MLSNNQHCNINKVDSFLPFLWIKVHVVEIPSLTHRAFDWSDWWISLVCLNPWLGTSGPNGEQRQKSTCPIATHPPVKAIMGNTERHSFNFILFTVQAALYNVIISSRSAGSSDRAMLSRHWGNANWFHISHGIFKASTCYTDCHFKQRYEKQREMSNCGLTILYGACCLLWSPAHGTRYILMPHGEFTI